MKRKPRKKATTKPKKTTTKTRSVTTYKNVPFAGGTVRVKMGKLRVQQHKKGSKTLRGSKVRANKPVRKVKGNRIIS